jgi:hypothetical protein
LCIPSWHGNKNNSPFGFSIFTYSPPLHFKTIEQVRTVHSLKDLGWFSELDFGTTADDLKFKTV